MLALTCMRQTMGSDNSRHVKCEKGQWGKIEGWGLANPNPFAMDIRLSSTGHVFRSDNFNPPILIQM